MDKPMMIVGIDVVHYTGKGKESVIGFAATMDRYISKYYLDSISKVPNKKGGKAPKLQEIDFELEPLFMKAILKFKEANGIAP